MTIGILLAAAVIGTSTGQAPQVECKGEAILVFSIANMRDKGVPWERVVKATNDMKDMDPPSRAHLLEIAADIYKSKDSASDLHDAMFKACMENLTQTRD